VEDEYSPLGLRPVAELSFSLHMDDISFSFWPDFFFFFFFFFFSFSYRRVIKKTSGHVSSAGSSPLCFLSCRAGRRQRAFFVTSCNLFFFFPGSEVELTLFFHVAEDLVEVPGNSFRGMSFAFLWKESYPSPRRRFLYQVLHGCLRELPPSAKDLFLVHIFQKTSSPSWIYTFFHTSGKRKLP